MLHILAYCYPNIHGSREVARESRRLAPPMLDISIPYRAWKNTLQMWTLVCVVNKKEQGMLILLHSFSNSKKSKNSCIKFN